MRFSLVRKKISLHLAPVFVSFLTSVSVIGCPDLSRFYELLDESPSSLQAELYTLLGPCSENSEYFALLGASQLADGDLLQALENLELALLIDPDSGAAAVDYAEVLYRQGQILSALEINEQIMTREDLPEALKSALVSRQRRWSADRIVKNFSLAAFVGFDDNLNSAPISEQLSLTLSGKSVTLEVSPEYQAKSGSYSRLVTSASYSRFGQAFNAQVSGQLSARFAEDSRYELVQASTQANISQARDRSRWMPLPVWITLFLEGIRFSAALLSVQGISLSKQLLVGSIQGLQRNISTFTLKGLCRALRWLWGLERTVIFTQEVDGIESLLN